MAADKALSHVHDYELHFEPIFVSLFVTANILVYIGLLPRYGIVWRRSNKLQVVALPHLFGGHRWSWARDKRAKEKQDNFNRTCRTMLVESESGEAGLEIIH